MSSSIFYRRRMLSSPLYLIYINNNLLHDEGPTSGTGSPTKPFPEWSNAYLSSNVHHPIKFLFLFSVVRIESPLCPQTVRGISRQLSL